MRHLHAALRERGFHAVGLSGEMGQRERNDALQALRDVIEQYPESEYARSAILKFDLAFDQRAATEMEIGRYYLKRGAFLAAANRAQFMITTYPNAPAQEEALFLMMAAYEAMLADAASRLRPGEHVLEIGSGTGGPAIRLAAGVAR